ncbi:unnamed protein product, partial [Pocillopora meandrina]
LASTSVCPLTVLTEVDSIPGSKFEKDLENYTVEQLRRNYKLFLVPLIPTVGWHAFPSQNIPSLFNYEQTYHYALESIQHFSREDQDNRLGYMTDKPVKNSIKNGDSGFV